MIDMIRTIISSVREGAIKRFSGTGRPDESFADREYFQHYGFTSRPKKGAEGLAIKKGNVVFLIGSDDRRYRIAIEEGEVALYTDEGDRVHLKRGEIRISSQGRVSVDAPQITITAPGPVTVNAVNASVVASGSIGLTAPTTVVNGALQVNGGINATGNIVLTTGTVTNANGDVLHHH